MKRTFISSCYDDTRAMGASLARTLKPGDVVALRGDLGAGKTAFTSGALEALGCEGPFNSPTFAIAREYSGKNAECVHFDMYRIHSEQELYSTGFYDYLDEKHILFIEWCENIEWALPEDSINVTVEGSGEEERKITVEVDL